MDRPERTVDTDRANEDVLSSGINTREAADRSTRDDNDYTYDANTRDNSDRSTRDSVDVGIDNAAWRSNIKRTYDAYQDLDLGLARAQMAHLQRLNGYAELALSNAVSLANQVNTNTAAQANAVNTNLANLVNRVNNDAASVSNQAHADTQNHANVAASEIWSRLESSDLAESVEENEMIRTSSLDDASLKAIGAAVADAVTTALAGLVTAGNKPVTTGAKAP